MEGRDLEPLVKANYEIEYLWEYDDRGYHHGPKKENLPIVVKRDSRGGIEHSRDAGDRSTG